jgi:hypothetical protein
LIENQIAQLARLVAPLGDEALDRLDDRTTLLRDAPEMHRPEHRASIDPHEKERNETDDEQRQTEAGERPAQHPPIRLRPTRRRPGR